MTNLPLPSKEEIAAAIAKQAVAALGAQPGRLAQALGDAMVHALGLDRPEVLHAIHDALQDALQAVMDKRFPEVAKGGAY